MNCGRNFDDVELGMVSRNIDFDVELKLVSTV